MIKFYDVVKTFNKKNIALNRFNFNVKKGSIHALLGHNGAGKTTAFMIANRFIPFDSGNIVIMGKDVSKLSKKDIKKIGLVTDKMKLYKELTVKECLLFFINIYNIKNKNKTLNDIIESFDLKDFCNKKIKQLSTGMYKKTLIAISLIGDPDLVFLDEPFAGVDPVMIKKISFLIRQFNKEKNITFVISSHNLFEIEFVANEITIMKNGSTIISDSLENIYKEYDFDKSFTISYLKENRNYETTVKNEDELLKKIKFLEQNNFKIITINENKITLEKIYNRIYSYIRGN